MKERINNIFEIRNPFPTRDQKGKVERIYYLK
jgi:hypothetical protein